MRLPCAIVESPWRHKHVPFVNIAFLRSQSIKRRQWKYKLNPVERWRENSRNTSTTILAGFFSAWWWYCVHGWGLQWQSFFFVICHCPKQGCESTHTLHLYPLDDVFYSPWHRAPGRRDLDFTSLPKDDREPWDRFLVSRLDSLPRKCSDSEPSIQLGPPIHVLALAVDCLTHWEFRLRFHWSLFLRALLTIFHHRFR